jgi:hypothetical protein
MKLNTSILSVIACLLLIIKGNDAFTILHPDKDSLAGLSKEKVSKDTLENNFDSALISGSNKHVGKNGPSGKDSSFFKRIAEYNLSNENNIIQGALGFSNKGRLINAYYFPGITTKRAMVIGGVHGSELSAIEVADELIAQLKQGIKPYYSVIVIPCLFPDNAATAINNADLIGTVNNIGRYSCDTAIDPNRQMPTPGKNFDANNPTDHFERAIEYENRLLLELITQYRPERLVNLHAIRNTSLAGIYADPRADHNGYALGFEEDSSLAISMAKYISSHGGYVPGNRLHDHPTALYYSDPVPAPKGVFQKRKIAGSSLCGHRGDGISLGSWGSTAIEDTEHPENNRDAIHLITAEFPGSKRPLDYSIKTEREYIEMEVELYASSIVHIFLQAEKPFSEIARN